MQSSLKVCCGYMQSIGDGDDTVESSSKELMQTAEGFAPVFFDTRPLTNLLLIDELESLSPVLDMQVYCCETCTCDAALLLHGRTCTMLWSAALKSLCTTSVRPCLHVHGMFGLPSRLLNLHNRQHLIANQAWMCTVSMIKFVNCLCILTSQQQHTLQAKCSQPGPAMMSQVANLLNEEIPQIFTLCGRGPRSTLRLLRPGLAVTEMAVSPLPGNPTAVWTIKRSMMDDFDAYIIVSFTNATLVRPSSTGSR